VKLLILEVPSDGWLGIFFNGEIIDQGEPRSFRPDFWIDVAHRYKVHSKDVVYKDVNEEDEDRISKVGCFPNRLDELIGDYI